MSATPDGITIIKDDGVRDSANTVPVLLSRAAGLEVMRQTVLAEAMLWLTPASDPATVEFFCLLNGSLLMERDSGEVILRAGDCFQAADLPKEVFLTALDDTQLLYISNSPLFEMVQGFQSDLELLLQDINDKDAITYAHSKQVMRYAILLFNRLPEAAEHISADEMITAALFHDVGKCFVPDQVLTKKGKLTPEEWRYIVKHPNGSARLLRPRFGDKVAEIAQNHHERLDGSGYPFGLTGSDISFEARIVAVADVFDAMTSQRSYNTPRTFPDAAQELLSLGKQFDSRITAALADLVSSGALQPDESETSSAMQAGGNA